MVDFSDETMKNGFNNNHRKLHGRVFIIAMMIVNFCRFRRVSELIALNKRNSRLPLL